MCLKHIWTSCLIFITTFVPIIFLGCASPLEKEVSRIFDQINDNIGSSLQRRISQNNFKISLLNDELKNSELSGERKGQIQAEIKRLDDEKQFIFSLKPEELQIKFAVLEEYAVSPEISEIKIKITGKTLQSTPGEKSSLINIPEEASFLLFKYDKSKSKNKISGPFQFTP